MWPVLLKYQRLLSMLLFLLVAIVFGVDVTLRYLFGVTTAWIVELEWYLCAIAIMLSLGPALKADKHVRVDVLRGRFSPSVSAWIDRIGHLLFLLPWSLFLVYASAKYAYNSYLIGEGSPDPGGLPWRWLIKFFIPYGFLVLFLTGVGLIRNGFPKRNAWK